MVERRRIHFNEAFVPGAYQRNLDIETELVHDNMRELPRGQTKGKTMNLLLVSELAAQRCVVGLELDRVWVTRHFLGSRFRRPALTRGNAWINQDQQSRKKHGPIPALVSHFRVDSAPFRPC